ncbi:hypothetical protein DWF00_21090 [Bosea caraganae]|uniref:Histidinol phosphatase n=1 Tax=Bosea caraganae TaxID=2763117 RepID=A0A370L631_9HYPH|nr:DUF6282 family protein [Bosea caraganae]RDJ23147.1 hypothetical protein DWF00_21090 [Bosea caraganae]RDJ24740.1 hypothetical protein DWE98_13810 [Bosea caraganae]
MAFELTPEHAIPAAHRPAVERLLVGSVDLHCHSGPSLMPRSLDSATALEEAAQAGMRAVLVKDHFYGATPLVTQLQTLFAARGVTLLSGVPLNNSMGGLNRFAVAHGLNIGARYVWMPTLSAANHVAYERGKLDPKGNFPRPTKAMPEAEPLSVLDGAGKLREELGPILDLIAAHDAVLSSGHLNIREIWPLFEEAKRRGVTRMVTNHPTYIIGASLADIRALVGMGAYIEHSIGMYVPVTTERNHRPDELRDVIEAAGVGRTFFGSDLGQRNNGHPILGFKHMVSMLLTLGYSNDDITRMISGNAAALVGLDRAAA